MPTLPTDPLRRVTLNLFEADVAWLIKTYGPGWTVRVRDHIHNEVLRRDPNYATLYSSRTIGTIGDFT